MQRAEQTGPGVGPPQNIVDEVAVGHLGIGKVRIFALLGEGIGVQPVQQLHIQPDGAEAELGRVHMQVRQPREDELVRVIILGQMPEFLRALGKDTLGQPIHADQVPAPLRDKPVPRRRVAEIAVQYK